MSRSLFRSTTVGDIRVHTLDAGEQRLDGGAMFGVVPKPLWEKRIPADEQNRIPLALRCLLVEAGDALVLIDTGVGNKESERFHSIYGVENEGEPTRLENAIREVGFAPSDVDIVLNTHLHFDHAGGNTVLTEGGTVEPAFPGARYVVQKGELEFARWKNPRIQASYLPHNIDPVAAAELYDLVEGEARVAEGVRVIPTPGHTPHHQSVVIESRGERALFLADVCPTSAHLPLPWIMGYDVEPLVTLETKQRLWPRLAHEGWMLFFEHDPVVHWGRIRMESDRPVLYDTETEQNLQ